MHKVKAELIFRNIRKDEERYRLTDDDGNVKFIRIKGGLLAPWADIGTKGNLSQKPDGTFRFHPDATDISFYSKQPNELIAYTGL